MSDGSVPGSTGDVAGDDAASTDAVCVAFVCVQNAGRSQMAAAFARREREQRDLAVEVLTGGTHPTDRVHEAVVEAMAELEIDLADRTPREISTAELERCDYVATMGCSTLTLDADVDVRDWALDDPDGSSPGRVREIRETIRQNVSDLFDEIEADLS